MVARSRGIVVDRALSARWALLALVLLAATLRLRAAAGDLWLDEIWSLRMAADAPSAAAVVFSLHHDNNHPLNTLYLRALGRQDSFLPYRLLAIVSGTVAVAAAWVAGRRSGRIAAALAALLVAVAPILVLLGSEARGYAPAIALALGAYLAFERHLDSGRGVHAVAFVVAAVLGILAHRTVAYVVAGALVWWAVRWWPRRRGVRGALRSFLAVLAVPLAVAFAVLVVDARRRVIGGGDPAPWLATFVRSFSVALGGPALGWGAIGLGAAACAACALALVRARADGSGRWAFFATVIFAAPVAARLALPSEIVYERYFAVGLAFALVLGGAAAAPLARSKARALLLALFVLLFVGGSAAQLVPLFRHGRGEYTRALRYLDRETTGPRITVSSDHDFRNQFVLSFYVAMRPPSKPVDYFGHDDLPTARPEWFLVQHATPDSPPQSLVLAPDLRYDQAAVFPHGGLSGWTWCVYRRHEGS